MKFGIVGCGSMGKRRARCLHKLGHTRIVACDSRPDRRDEIGKLAGVVALSDFESLVAAKPDFVLLCLPPHLHAPHLLKCIEAGVSVFCESPAAMTLQEMNEVIDASEKCGVFVAPSTTYLQNEIHRAIAALLESGRLGKPLGAISHVGQHVADWHPYEDYRAFYASKRAEGGMCFDMLPHELHLFTHLFGRVRSLACMARMRSVGIDTDPGACDVFDVLLDMAAGVSLVIHQDMFQRPFGIYRKIMCERGAIEWNWRTLRMCEYSGPQFLDDPAWRDITPERYDFEDMYVAEITHALNALEGKEEYLMPPRREREILAVMLACETSSATGRQIEIM